MSRVPAPERLLIVAPNWLGDAVMALPAIDDLRRSFPGAGLTVAARRQVADLFAMVPSIDTVIRMEWSGRLWSRESRRRDLETLRALRADAAVLLPNSFASAWLVAKAGIPERWGYATDMRRRLLSRAIARPEVRRHQARYYQYLVAALGVPNGPLAPRLAVPVAAIEEARRLLLERGWDGSRPLVVAAPGAAYGGAKRWPAVHFAATVTDLVTGAGTHCALVGAGADTEATRQLRSLVPEDARRFVSDLAGATTLQVLAGVMSLARACVSNDSGAMHLAGAAGVPLVAVFGPTRERETRPLAGAGQRVELAINHVWCRPCMLRECPLDHRCMNGLRPARVLPLVTDLLRDGRANAGPRILNPEP